MKKTLTTLMVLALALVATSAMAGDGAWSFYGKLHTSINMIDDSANSQLGLSSNTSRIGSRGTRSSTRTSPSSGRSRAPSTWRRRTPTGAPTATPSWA
jgi:hypothetical protein